MQYLAGVGGEEIEQCAVFRQAFQAVVHAPVTVVGVPPLGWFVLAPAAGLVGVVTGVGAFVQPVLVSGVELGQQG